MLASHGPDRRAFWILCAWLTLVFFLGGASRSTEVAQHVLRLLGVCVFVLVLWHHHRAGRGYPPALCMLLLALFLVMLGQLIPLPPQIWQILPGRAIFAAPEAPALLGSAPWRPLSLDPYATLNAALALIVPTTTILTCAAVSERDMYRLPLWLAGLAGVSALWGALQAVGAASFSMYRVVTPGSAIGLFANRNHQALLLAIEIMLLVVCALLPLGSGRKPSSHRALCAIGALALIPLIMVTGSRAGLLLLFVGLLGSGWILASRRPRADDTQVLPGGNLLIASLVCAVILLTGFLSQSKSIQRIVSDPLNEDLRRTLLQPILDLAWTYFPAGAGFGSFPTVFRIDEPLESLRAQYLNHAHNDILEVVIDAGAFGCVLLLSFAGWFAYHARAWLVRSPLASPERIIISRLGVVTVLMIFAASLWDYPLRTPIIQSLLVIACWFIWRPSVKRTRVMAG